MDKFISDRVYNPVIQGVELTNERTHVFKNLKLCGLDWIIDKNGVPFLLEGNGNFFVAGADSEIDSKIKDDYYYHLYDDGARKAFLETVKDYDRIGINIIPEDWLNDSFRKSRAEEAWFFQNLFESAGKKVTLFRDDDFFNTDIETRIDVLFNRVPGIPRSYQEYDFKIPVISPVKATKFLVDKYDTLKALEGYVPTPLTYKVNNEEELREAIKNVERHVEENRPGYDKPYIVLKPLDDTGSRGLIFLDDSSSKMPELTYPYLVEERIVPQKLDGHIVDIRSYFIDGWTGNGIARSAPSVVGESTDPYKTLVTGLSQNGIPYGVSEEANKTLRQLSYNAAVALDNHLENLK